MNWLEKLFRKRKLEAQLDSELRFHLEQRAADLIAAGVAPAEARRRATLEFGGIENAKEECREARGAYLLETVLQDIRYALRTLRKAPGFTLVAILTLALGIGGTTAIFTLVQQVMLRSLPVAKPAQLWLIGDADSCCYSDGYTQVHGDLLSRNDWSLFSWQAYKLFRANTPAFEHLAAFQHQHPAPGLKIQSP